MSLTYSRELVTPEIAEAWLSKRAVYQRAFSRTAGDKIADEMRNGHFDPDNGQTISFDEDGQLADGQHRMWGVVASGMTFHFHVMRGVSKSAFDTMDTGKPRLPADVLAREQCANARTVAAICAVIFRFDVESSRFKTTGVKKPHRVFRQFWNANKDELSEAVTVSRACREVAPAAALGAFFFLTSRIDGEKAREFFEGLASGANLSPTSPILHTRNKLIGFKATAKGGKDILDLFPYLATGWRKHLEGSEVVSLRAATNCTLVGVPTSNPTWLVF